MSSNKSLLTLLRKSENGDYRSRLNLPFTFSLSKSYFTKNLKAHTDSVNAIEFNSSGSLMVSESEDRKLLLWNTERLLTESNDNASHFELENNSDVFCLSFSSDSTSVYSGGNEEILVHDVKSRKLTDQFFSEDIVTGIDAHPYHPHLFVSACSDGTVQAFDRRSGTSILVAKESYTFHRVVFNPTDTFLLATANQKTGIGLWDLRHPQKILLKYEEVKSAMYVDFNSLGTFIVALSRQSSPLLFDIRSPKVIAEFDSPGYYNNCTNKSIRFAGFDDEFIVTGSDDFRIYLWRLPNLSSYQNKALVNKAEIILGAHRSIVNHIRFNKERGFMASCGVEKMIKLWSPYRLPGSQSIDNNTFVCRKVYSPEDYIHLVVHGESQSNGSTSENERMMAFFDSLLQRKLENWSSEEEEEEEEEEENEGIRKTIETTELQQSSIFELIEKQRQSLSHRRSRQRKKEISVSNSEEKEEEEKSLFKERIQKRRKISTPNWPCSSHNQY